MTIRVLHVLPELQPGGGMSTVVMNYLRNINHDEFIFDVICHMPYDDSYKLEVEKYGGKVTYFPKIGLSNIRDSIERVDKYFDNNNYDVVHCHMANAAFIYLKIAKEKGVGLRILHSHQDHYADTWRHAARNYPLVSLGKRYANYYVACSIKAGDFLFGNKTYTILKNSIPIDQYAFKEIVRDNWRYSNNVIDDIVFANIGRLTLQKNQKFVLDIFSKIHKIIPKSKLFFAGDGELREELHQYSKSLNIQNEVVWLGNIDIKDLYQGIDVLLFPSLYEGLPMVLVEAQAAGVQSIASNQISEEAMVTDFVEALPIDKGVAPWVEAAVKASSKGGNTNRSNGAIELREAGFDIYDTVRDLEKIYIDNIRR